MKLFIVGLVVGSALTASMGLAGQFYNSKGEPSGPAGSIQQYDYFRQRGAYLDLQALRRQADRQRVEGRLGKPCQ
jgi:hypothetical protein